MPKSVSPRNALAFRCLTCGAAPKEVCELNNGQHRPEPHRLRSNTEYPTTPLLGTRMSDVTPIVADLKKQRRLIARQLSCVESALRSLGTLFDRRQASHHKSAGVRLPKSGYQFFGRKAS